MLKLLFIWPVKYVSAVVILCLIWRKWCQVFHVSFLYYKYFIMCITSTVFLMLHKNDNGDNVLAVTPGPEVIKPYSVLMLNSVLRLISHAQLRMRAHGGYKTS